MIKNANLDKAFADLESLGYFAKRNWQCCSNCGLAAITEEDSKKFFFLHAQAEENLEYYEETYANWAGDAKEIVTVLTRNGIITGGIPDKDTKIKLYADDES